MGQGEIMHQLHQHASIANTKPRSTTNKVNFVERVTMKAPRQLEDPRLADHLQYVGRIIKIDEFSYALFFLCLTSPSCQFID